MTTLSQGQRGLTIPGGLLGMLFLLAVTESYVARHDLDFTRPDFWDWRLTGRNAQTNVRDCQVLCFGTSRIQQAILPRVIEHQSGLKTWNLGLCWGQAPAAYFLLERALKSGATPSTVLVEYHPTTLMEDPWGAKGFWPELLTVREAYDLAWSARDPTFFGSMTLARYFASVKDRSQLRVRIMAALKGENAGSWVPTLVTMRNRNFNRGAFVMPNAKDMNGNAKINYQAAFLGKSWSCTPLNASYIRRFLSLAREHKIQVYWVLPPFTLELQNARERANQVALYESFVRGWLAEFPNLNVIDAERSGYVAGVFSDAAHLGRDGATTLSASVGALLRSKQPTSGERWVRLPQYEVTAPSVRVEDITMSADYLLQIGKIRR